MKTEGPKGEVEFKLDPDAPISIGPLDLQDFYFEHKVQQMEAMKGTLKAIKAVDNEFEKITGRKLEYVYPYKMEDAEVAVVGLGLGDGYRPRSRGRAPRRGRQGGHGQDKTLQTLPSRRLEECDR